MKTRYLTILLALTALVFSGCKINSSATGSNEVNLLGVVQYEQATYEETSPLSFRLSTEEIITQKNYSGDKMSLLWGLVTLTDY